LSSPSGDADGTGAYDTSTRLHATRSNIRSDNGTSSLPEQRIERRFFLFRWHRAYTSHTGNVSPYSDLHRPMGWFPGAYDLRALSWTHGRVWGAAGRGCTSPAEVDIPNKARLHRRNAQSAHSPAKPACGSRAQRLPRRAHVSMTGRAGHTRLGTRPSVGGGRRPDILGRGTCAHDAIGTRPICTRFFALAASLYHYLTGYCFWSHAGHVLVSYAPVPSASPDASSNRKARSTLQSRAGVSAHSHMNADVAARHSSGLSAIPSAAQPCVSKWDEPPAVREPRRMRTCLDIF